MFILKHLQFQKMKLKTETENKNEFEGNPFTKSQADWDEINWKLQIPELLPCGPFSARMRDYTTVICLMERHNSVSFTVFPFFKTLPATNVRGLQLIKATAWIPAQKI